MSKEKQIEEEAEMLAIIEHAREIYANDITDHSENEYIREGLLDAGYRKQSEGEWKIGSFNNTKNCSICGDYVTFMSKYCPNCGAKMKGGAE